MENVVDIKTLRWYGYFQILSVAYNMIIKKRQNLNMIFKKYMSYQSSLGILKYHDNRSRADLDSVAHQEQKDP